MQPVVEAFRCSACSTIDGGNFAASAVECPVESSTLGETPQLATKRKRDAALEGASHERG
jgi:hypothetical protein